MKKILYFASAMMLVLTSCTNDEIDDLTTETKQITLSASLETNPTSRVNYTSGDGTFFWTTEDTISVYTTLGSFCPLAIESGAGNATATFTGDMTGAKTMSCAVYPGKAGKSYSSNTLTFNAPSEYHYKYVQSNFPTAMTANVNSSNMPMVAKIANTGDSNLEFKNLGGLFCIKITRAPANTCKIVFSTGSKICGTFSVDLSAETPTMQTEETTKNSEKAITVTFDALTKASDLVVYIPVPCGTYNGYAVQMFNNSGTQTGSLSSTKTKVIGRSTALRFNGIELSRYNNGHDYVDLGLTSGLKWATCNIGATTPTAYGDYYQWGATATNDYTSPSSITANKTLSELETSGIIDSKKKLTSAYDAASVNWGGTWRMPTDTELEELVSECTWTWATVSGINGYTVTGPNSNSIFLPAAGYYVSSSLHSNGQVGYYWSANAEPKEAYAPCESHYLYISSSSKRVNSDNYRYYGVPIRPVIE